MQAQNNDECPYIKNGLVFWLDGILKGTDSSKWVDRIGRREFTLTGCTFAETGVTFSDTNSGGDYNGSIDVPWNTGTIECAVDNLPTNSIILMPYNQNGNSNIGMIKGTGTNLGYRLDGSGTPRAYVTAGAQTVSINIQSVVYDKKISRFQNNEIWSNSNSKTTLGYRNGTKPYHFIGTMYSVRIYDRLLSTDEMLYNQTVDCNRFNLELN